MSGCITEIAKVSVLEKQEITDADKSLIQVEWFSVKDAKLLSAEDEWEKF